MRVFFGLLFLVLAAGLVFAHLLFHDGVAGGRLILMTVLVTGSMIGAGMATENDVMSGFRKVVGAISLLITIVVVAYIALKAFSGNAYSAWQYVVWVYYAAVFGILGWSGIHDAPKVEMDGSADKATA